MAVVRVDHQSRSPRAGVFPPPIVPEMEIPGTQHLGADADMAQIGVVAFEGAFARGIDA